MLHHGRPPAPDQTQRDAAIHERARNVLIDAGTGTGKTTTLVDRLLELVAPTSSAPVLSIGRIAVLTFTRKAAGELRLKIRERLLGELAEPAPPAPARSDHGLVPIGLPNGPTDGHGGAARAHACDPLCASESTR
jgi:ATP-dependent helicase/nuclease subunit A